MIKKKDKIFLAGHRGLLGSSILRNLKKRGFKFVGSTICYAFMQAAGLVNDHTTDCFRYNAIKSQGRHPFPD